MSVLLIVVPLALLIVAVAIAAYVWSARSGQFDDLHTPALRALHDDEPRPAGRAAAPSAGDATAPDTPAPPHR